MSGSRPTEPTPQDLALLRRGLCLLFGILSLLGREAELQTMQAGCYQQS